MVVPVTPAAISGPSTLGHAADMRGRRKVGSGNIFRGVDRQQLRRLFHASGDGDAERRAWLVWDLCDRPELAKALRGLRVRSCKNGLRQEETRCVLGSRWLHAFCHLRIDDGSASSPDEEEETDHSADQRGTSEAEGATSLWHQAGTSRNPDRYLYLTLH